ncbi:MAG TPA: hypothetical protein VGO64_04140, partial [Candidatus Limnocylindrales bacterium]|nr:hypothetical protein [Candidatus Limnocylindrales bacterium]
MKRPSAHMAPEPSRTTSIGQAADAGQRSSGSGSRRTSRLGRRLARRLPLLILIPILVGIVGGPVSPVGADQLSDARARQSALAQQLQHQKAQIAQINALQADLGAQISSTKHELNGINANLVKVKASITLMAKKIDAVRRQYLAQVAMLQQLDVQLDRITVQEDTMTMKLRQRKELLAERLRQAYDTDRTSMVETFLSGESFTDVLSQVSYTIDVSEQDKA